MTDGVAAAGALSSTLRIGGDEALKTQAPSQAAAFGDGLRLQEQHYGTVRRWPDAPFWQRRAHHGSVTDTG
jgi:hypothetical protein